MYLFRFIPQTQLWTVGWYGYEILRHIIRSGMKDAQYLQKENFRQT